METITVRYGRFGAHEVVVHSASGEAVAAKFETIRGVPDSGKVAAEAYAGVLRNRLCLVCEERWAEPGDDCCRLCIELNRRADAEDRAHAVATTKTLGF